VFAVSSPKKKPITRYRERMKRRGYVRVEVKVRKEDAPLLRNVADALTDPKQASEARALLRERFTPRAAKGLKALLAEAPLDGIEIDRPRDTGRSVEL
jgi:hypothetical protein